MQAKFYYFLKKVSNGNALVFCAIFLAFFKILTVFALISMPETFLFADITKSSLVSLVNQARESVGLKQLSENEKLNEAAQLKAENMLINNYFSHISPSGVTPWHWFIEAGYDYKLAGENLAIGFFESEEVYNAWVSSSSHRDNLLNPDFTEIGTAIVPGFGENDAVVVVQLFGTPKSFTAIPQDSLNVNNSVAKVEDHENEQDLEEPNIAPAKKVMTFGSKMVLGAYEGLSNNNLFSRAANYLLYSQESFLNILALVILFISAFSLFCLSILFKEPVFKKTYIFKAVLIVLLISVSLFDSAEIATLLLGHKTII